MRAPGTLVQSGNVQELAQLATGFSSALDMVSSGSSDGQSEADAAAALAQAQGVRASLLNALVNAASNTVLTLSAQVQQAQVAAT